MDDLISRQAAIDAPEKYLKDCNPEHFIGQRKFIEFMDDAEIGSFGMWQFANGFNMGLTAAEVAINQLPSAQPRKGKWYKPEGYPRDSYRFICDNCQDVAYFVTGNNGKKNKEDHPKCEYRFCPNCGASMSKGEEDG